MKGLLPRWLFGLVSICICDGSVPAADATPARELVRDPHFQNGFYLLETAPGKRVVYSELPGRTPGKPVWDLAQWSSRFPLEPGGAVTAGDSLTWTNGAKRVVVGKPGSERADLSLRVNAGAEYPRARVSTAEPWVHLLVQQDFREPPSLGELSACRFRMEARLLHSKLADTNGYSAAIHAAQFLVYLTVANRNPSAPGYQECFWFGIPVYDDRHRVVPAYEAQDFGDTKLFIFNPASDTFASKSTHDGEWVTFEKDLLPLMRRGIERARAKGFIRGSTGPADFRPLGIFIGWEVPGSFDVEMQIRNLSLKAAKE